MLPARAEPLVVFELDEQRFALPLRVVERVVRAVAVTPFPAAPRGVLGLVNVAGTVAPVFDFRRRFAMPAREVRARDHFILARSKGRLVAVLADSVQTVTVDAPPPLDPEDLVAGQHACEGVIKLAGDLVFIHDLDRFLSAEEFAAVDGELAAR